MEIGERGIAAAAAAFAIVGIALLLFFSETPQSASVAKSSVAEENSLFILSGTAANVTSDRFSLCESGVCISVRKGGIASAELVAEGRGVVVEGRVREYMGKRYVEAEKINLT